MYIFVSYSLQVIHHKLSNKRKHSYSDCKSTSEDGLHPVQPLKDSKPQFVAFSDAHSSNRKEEGKCGTAVE
jgi:hypothetical protein